MGSKNKSRTAVVSVITEYANRDLFILSFGFLVVMSVVELCLNRIIEYILLTNNNNGVVAKFKCNDSRIIQTERLMLQMNQK